MNMADDASSETNVPRKRQQIRPLPFLLVALVLVSLMASGWLYWHRDNSPISKGIRRSVGFVLYYPSSLPSGYSLEKGSVKTTKDIVFYTLRSGSQTVIISEQAAPKNPPDFDAIQKGNTSFKNINSDAGQAIIGTNLQSESVTAILVTNTTLVNISSSKNVPLDVVTKITRNMSSLPN